MNNLLRNKRGVYICEAYQDDMIRKFHQPKYIRENYEPTNSDGDLIAIGMEYPMYLRIKTSAREKNLFHPKDRLYVYVKPPKQHDILCETCDYEVYKEPMVFINEMEVMLKRLSDDEES
jgi:hypothetical protein